MLGKSFIQAQIKTLGGDSLASHNLDISEICINRHFETGKPMAQKMRITLLSKHRDYRRGIIKAGFAAKGLLKPKMRHQTFSNKVLSTMQLHP
jgi:hypothetical protein